MAGWPGKYVIGLTGNIATGKSAVRRMLEHLGAYGIDADALAHRAISLGGPGYLRVARLFGEYILDEDGQINRARLGRIVFADPEALKALEKIVHPLVRQAINLLVQRAPQKVIVIEAIKLLEGELRAACDTIWVTKASREVQLNRLVTKRHMTEGDALQRIQSQSPQVEKIAAANVVIDNSGSIEDTWRQVVEAWQSTLPPAVIPREEAAPVPAAGELSVIKARPKHAQQIADYLAKVADHKVRHSRMDVLEAFGEKAFLLLQRDEKVVGLVGWQVENLVTRVDEIYVDAQIPLADAGRMMIGEVERASRELQCEAALLFLPKTLARAEKIWAGLGYEKRTVESLGVRAWQEAARESRPADSELFFHQLRKDRVLRPV
jgi:dephospho-CoA kinase